MLCVTVRIVTENFVQNIFDHTPGLFILALNFALRLENGSDIKKWEARQLT